MLRDLLILKNYADVCSMFLFVCDIVFKIEQTVRFRTLSFLYFI